mmetsp:Transcript_74906/g.173654  ORF Transcript_74906/g.173654 Transcript_74906/m.173654 type:complete len:526 (-) Transcript_74906:108-1685(-)
MQRWANASLSALIAATLGAQGPKRLEALRLLIFATALKGDLAEATRLANAELDKSDKKSQVAMLHALAQVELVRGRFDAALDFAARADALLQESSETSVSLVLTKAEINLAKGSPRAALNMASKAMQMAGDKASEAAGWDALMRARSGLGKYDEAVKAAEAALVTYLDLGDTDGKAVTLLHLTTVHSDNGQHQKALKAGGMALEHFRQCNSIFEREALDATVRGLVGMEAVSEALRQARQGVAQLEKTGNKKMAALATTTLIRAYRANDKIREAVVAAKDALAIFHDLGEREHEGTMQCEVAKLYLELGQYDQCKELAEEALPLFKELGYVTQGEVTALELIGAAEDAKAKLQLEKDRQDQVDDMMSKLKSALINKDGPKFKEILDKVYSSEFVSTEDVKNTLMPVFERDPEETQNFWDANQPEAWPLPKQMDVDEDQATAGMFESSRSFDRRYLYFLFRVGAMGYGPGFRLLKTCFRKGPASYWSHGHSTLKLKDDHDDWEEYSGFHAGVLDCALQTGAARAQG